MAADWERVRDVFDRAEELPAAERAAFLESSCAGDEELLREVRSLLAAGDAAGAFLESLAAPEEDAAALAGQTLGQYRLECLLGQGGMGVVYRATDERLGRTVAVKFLRREVALTAEARRRFLREAKATAALDHPNIVTVHDAGHAAGRDFLVMEFVDGQTLASRLSTGPMPLAEALDCAIQVAAALEAAHQTGILHRDLKPQNVMLTGPASGRPGAVKVVDFGLAKRNEGGPAQSGASQTRTGAVIGTAAYMSPEQVEGRTAGPQSDLFSFGTLLYEMIGGRRAFGGESAGAAMAAVLRDQPKPLDSPAWGIVVQCLEKDASLRFQTAGELRTALETLRAGGRPHERKRPRRWRWPVLVAAGVAATAATGLLSWRERTPQPARSVAQLTMDSGLTTEPALSRDGHLLAYASDRNGDHLEIWVQPMQGGAARRLTQGSADQHEPAFSPDGATICYRSEAEGGGLWAMPAAGGAPKLVMRGSRGAKYSPDGKWIACWTGLPGTGDLGAPGNARMFLILAAGGAPQPLAPEFTARNPVWAPDSKHILFAGTAATDLAGYDWWIADLAGGRPTRTGARRAIDRADLNLESMGIVPDPREWSVETGGVLFSAAGGESAGNLWAMPFSLLNWRTSGPPVRVTLSRSREDYPTANGGRIVFAGIDSQWNTWSLRGDELKPVTDRNSRGFMPSLSADGDRMVGIERSGPVAHDLRSGASWQLRAMYNCIWVRLSPDGSEALFMFQGGRRTILYSLPFEGGQPVEHAAFDSVNKVWDVSPDAHTVLAMTPAAPRGVTAIDLGTGRTWAFLAHASWNLYWATFSADGKWVAFTARSGPEQSAVFVAPFHLGASTSEREWVRVTDGLSNDTAPHWSPDGKRLYYFSDRDGFRCIWSVGFRNGLPGPLKAVRHFHESRHSLSGMPVSHLQLGVARDRLVFSVCEPAGNIYMAR